MRRAPELATAAALILLASALYLVAARAGSAAASGLVGHGLGVLGALIMLLGSFGYSWRKHPGRAGLGSMEQWLRLHVLSGIVGPYLVLLHTGFAFRGLAGVTFALMAVVVASGAVGRFAFTAIPRHDPDRVRREREALLRETEPVPAAYATSPDAPSSPAVAASPAAAASPGLAASPATPPWPDAEAIAAAREVERRALAKLAAERERALAGAARAATARRALSWWWLLHVPLALAMFALALVHALGALYYATLLR